MRVMLLLLMLPVLGWGQTFNDIHYVGSHTDAYASAVFPSDSGYIVVGTEIFKHWSGPNTSRFFICHIAKDGSIQRVKETPPTPHLVYMTNFDFSPHKKSGNVIYGGGVSYYDNPLPQRRDYEMNFTAFNLDGDSILYKNFEGDSTLGEKGIGAIQVEGGNYVVMGEYTNTTTASHYTMLSKINSSGDVIWDTTFPTSFWGRTISYEGNGQFLIGGAIKHNQNWRPGFFLFDSTSAQIGQYLFDTTTVLNIVSHTSTRDGGYLAWGYESVTVCKLIRYNAFFQKQWETPFYIDTFSLLTNVKEDPFGNIYGSTGTPSLYIEDGPYHLLKFNSTGDLLWEREVYHTTPGFGRLYDFYPDSSGVVGVGEAADKEYIWIFKTDSLGCVIPGCDTINTAIPIAPENPEVKMYPNPASDFIHIADGAESTVEIFDIYGRMQLQVKISESGQVDISGIPRGTYLVRLSDGSRHSNFKKLLKL